jgi:hypothetical protein
VCGDQPTEGAHVKPRVEFIEGEDDRFQNIISLCPTHHELFDAGKIGLDMDRVHVLMEDSAGRVQRVRCVSAFLGVRATYIQLKNEYASMRIRFRLGMIEGSGSPWP